MRNRSQLLYNYLKKNDSPTIHADGGILHKIMLCSYTAKTASTL